jgi:hypothetical protein
MTHSASRRACRPFGSIATLGPLGTIRPLRTIRTFRTIGPHHAVVTAMTAIGTAIVPPAPLAVALTFDLLDLRVSRGDLLRRGRRDVRKRQQPQGEQGRNDSKMLHDSRPPYRLTR